jgi:PAS domain S-box-containing protein
MIVTKREKEFIELQGHFTDVTEILEAKRILTERQKNVLEFIANSNDAIIGIDSNEIIVDYNKKALSIFYLSENINIRGEKIGKFLEKTEDGKNWKEIFDEANKGLGNLYVFKIEKGENQGFLYLEVSVNPIDVKGTTTYYLILRDITERKVLEKEIVSNKVRYEALVNAIPDLIFVLDYDGNYVDYTADKSSPLYTEPQKIIGKNLKDFFRDENLRNYILAKVRETIDTGKLNIVTYRMDSRLGVREFEARISKIDDKRILSIVRDITEQKLN